MRDKPECPAAYSRYLDVYVEDLCGIRLSERRLAQAEHRAHRALGLRSKYWALRPEHWKLRAKYQGTGS